MKRKLFFIGIVLILAVTSCSEFQKVVKSSDYDLKYDKALEYYNNEDYFRAQQLFEELLTLFKGSTKGEEVYFYYAYCYYGQGNYILAGYHFRSFAKTYPNSKHTEECEFLSAYCFYLDSPGPDLDQTNTRRAIDALQLFINKYPESKRIEECNELIDKLHNKLEIKSYNSAKLYFDLGDYKAANVALSNALKDYPDSQFREELLYLLLKSNFLLAENSIESKQKERFQNTIEQYYALIDEYPKTDHLKEAEKLYEQSLNMIKQIN
ncbi:MAG: outer membrane protein assembly factor BamD [Marinilabiliales bacterium]|nr:MAG: outer membrane protein assembly factor BamD [Marinilabiliales bacterium]